MKDLPPPNKLSDDMRARLREHDPAHPPRDWPTNEIEAGIDWLQEPEPARSALVRRHAEARRGVAIINDRVCGRGKYALDGFFGLELAEEDLYRAACVKAPQDKLAAAAERVKKLRAGLAADEKRIASMLETAEAIKAAEPIAAAHGMTVKQWLGACVNIERQIAADLIGGLFAVCAHMNVDPLAVFAHVLAQPEPTHVR